VNSAENVLAVGSGRGFILKKLREIGVKNIWGCDLLADVELQSIDYQQGNKESLPFADESFDVVICSHVLDHVRNLDKAIREIKRVAKKKIIIIVTKQQYYYSILDLHIRFFFMLR